MMTWSNKYFLQQDHGMEWDDDGMNITVNPLDDVEKSLGGGATYLSEDESSDDGDRFEFYPSRLYLEKYQNNDNFALRQQFPFFMARNSNFKNCSECSYHDEEEMSEEEDEDESEILPVNHQVINLPPSNYRNPSLPQAPPLEWDDEDHHDVTTPSTSRPLPGGSARPPSARSYRVWSVTIWRAPCGHYPCTSHAPIRTDLTQLLISYT